MIALTSKVYHKAKKFVKLCISICVMKSFNTKFKLAIYCNNLNLDKVYFISFWNTIHNNIFSFLIILKSQG